MTIPLTRMTFWLTLLMVKLKVSKETNFILYKNIMERYFLNSLDNNWWTWVATFYQKCPKNSCGLFPLTYIHWSHGVGFLVALPWNICKHNICNIIYKYLVEVHLHYASHVSCKNNLKYSLVLIINHIDKWIDPMNSKIML